MLEYALHYVKIGWSVIPVAANKRPLLNWKQYQNQRASPEQVRAWWDKWPDANVGIVTGRVSNLVVIDIDDEEGLELLKQKIPNIFDSTLVCKTGGGGYHLYYRHPNRRKTIPNGVRVLPGVDVRADGGYVIAPPSLHASGNTYEWLGKANLGKVPKFLKRTLAGDTPNRLEELDWGIDIPEGGRDVELTRRAGKLFNADMPAKEVFEILRGWNRKHCKPPLPDSQVQKIVKSIAQRNQQEKQAAATTTSINEFKTVRFTEALNKYGINEIDWVIENWLPYATIGMAVAPPGQFKTWLFLDLALSVSTGKWFLNRYSVEQTGPVLIIQQEDPFPMLFSRLGTIMNLGEPKLTSEEFEISIPPAPPDDIHWHPDRQLSFDDENSIAGLQEAVHRIKPKLVLIDPLYSTTGTDDYMAKGAQSMLALKQMRDELGTSFFIAHHTKKRRNGGGREELWGSQFLNAWLETGWQIRPETNEENTIRLQRHFKNSKPLEAVHLHFDITTWNYEVEIIDETKAEGEFV